MKYRFVVGIILCLILLSFGVEALGKEVDVSVEIVEETEVLESELDPGITGLNVFNASLLSSENRILLIILIVIGLVILILLAVFIVMLLEKNKKLSKEKNLIDKENKEIEGEGEVLGEIAEVIEENQDEIINLKRKKTFKKSLNKDKPLKKFNQNKESNQKDILGFLKKNSTKNNKGNQG